MSMVKIIGTTLVLASTLVLSSCSDPFKPRYANPGGWEDRINGDKTVFVYGKVEGDYYSKIMHGPSYCFRVNNGVLYNDCINKKPNPVSFDISLENLDSISVISGQFILATQGSADVDNNK